MTGISEILLASDFSARSDRPLDRAILLARDLSARLAIAHVIEGGARNAGSAGIADVEAKLRADLPDAAREADLVVRPGSVPAVLGEIASERGSDLVVTGLARYNSIGDYILGTAVAHIIGYAGKPVLVVRKRPKGPYRKIVIATDFSDVSRASLLYAARLFPEASFIVIHAYHVPYEGWLKSDDTRDDVRAEHQGYMDKFLAETPLPEVARGRLVGVLEDGDLTGVVMRSVEAHAADLLVLGMHARGEHSPASIGGNIESLLAVADADVLVVRAPDRPDRTVAAP